MTSRHRGTFRLAALVALAAPVLAACSLDNRTMGIAAPPTPGDTLFVRYVAVGTSIGAGFQSAGINDSTQRQSYAVLVAKAAGLTPGLDWFYPSFAMPGCPAPYVNPLTGARVGGQNNPKTCALRAPSSVSPIMNNVSIPGIRLAQILNIDTVPYGVTDTLNLSPFITGGRSPVDVAIAEHATFITWESFANDVLGAATHGDTTLLTPMTVFNAYLDAAAAKFDSMGAKVAVINIPSNLPYFSQGVVFFCLATGAPGCPVPATLPYSLPTFTVDPSCAPSAAGGVGDSMLVGFPATATITPKHTVTAIPQGPVLSKPKVITIFTRIAQMNASIAQRAGTHGYALINFNAALAAQAALIPPFPSLTTPNAVFGPLFTLDGVHPSAALHKILADSIVSAVNVKYSTTMTLP